MSYQHLSFVDYRNTFFENQDHSLVDVRTTMEYAQGHVPGAINIPLNELATRFNDVARDKPIVVICASGNRSMSGSEILASAGFNDVYNLQGGTMVWMMNGLPLEH